MLPDPKATRAVLIGVDAYANLPPLPAVANNLLSLKALLQHPQVWGLPEEHCTMIANPGSPEQTLDRIEEVLSAATDTILVYFAGHGLLQPNTFNLILGLTETTFSRLRKGLRYEELRRVIIEATECSAKLVILDCCFSGAAFGEKMSAASDVADQARIDGTCLMTASADTALALAPPNERFTAFTGEIIHVLEHGIPGGPDLLDTDSVYRKVRAELLAKNRPIPQQRTQNFGRSIVLGRNRHVLPTRDPPTADTHNPSGIEEVQVASQKRKHPLVHHPDDIESILNSRPRALVEFINKQTQKGMEHFIRDILALTSIRRSGEELAAIVQLLPADSPNVITILNTTAARSPHDNVEFIDALRETAQPAAIASLVQSVAAAGAEALGALYSEIGRATYSDGFLLQLLNTLCHATDGEPTLLSEAIGLFWLDDAGARLDDLLDRFGASLPAINAMQLADALFQTQRTATAARLYAGHTEALARSRPVHDMVQLAALMLRAGLGAQADSLLSVVIEQSKTTQQMCNAIEALDAASLPTHIGEAISAAVRLFDEDILLDLGLMLKSRRHEKHSQSMLITAAVQGPPQRLLSFVDAYKEEGWPLGARRLFDATIISMDPEQQIDFIQSMLNEPNRLSYCQQAIVAIASMGPETFGAFVMKAAVVSNVQPILSGAAEDIPAHILLETSALLPAAEPAVDTLISSAVPQLEPLSPPHLLAAFASSGSRSASLFVKCFLTSQSLASACESLLSGTAEFMPSPPDVIRALSRRPGNEIQQFLQRMSVIAHSRLIDLVPHIGNLAAEGFSSAISALAPMDVDPSPAIHQFGGRRSAAEVNFVCNVLEDPMRMKLIQRFTAAHQASGAQLVHLAELRQSAGYHTDVAVILSQSSRAALPDSLPATAIAVLVAVEAFVRRHAEAHRWLCRVPLPVEWGHAAKQVDALGYDEVLAMVKLRDECIAFTGLGLYYHVGRSRRDYILLPYAEFAVRHASQEGKRVILHAWSSPGGERYDRSIIWSVRDKAVEPEHLLDLLTTIQTALNELAVYHQRQTQTGQRN